MPGPFDPVPFSTYQGAGAGAAQGLSALAQAFLARRQLGLQKQQFQLQQAEAGYQQPHQQQVYMPGRLAQPSMEASENVPTPTPGISAMGQGDAGTPGALARTTGSYKTVNVPGYYDITKSLPYAQAQLNGRLLAAMYGANSRERIEQERYGGGVDENGNPLLGSHYYEQQALLNQRGQQQIANDRYLYGGTDATGVYAPGARTESALTTQAPALQLRGALGQQSIAQRAQSLSETMRHNRVTEGQGGQRIGIAQQTAAQKVQALRANGVLSPKEASIWSSAYNGANFNGLSPDSAEARANQAVAAFRRTATGQTPPPPTTIAPPASSPGLVDRIENFFGGGKPAASGGALAPAVPRSGAEASGLTPQTTHGGNAPTVPLGSRPVSDATTRTYPHAQHLPKSPSAATVPASGAPGSAGKVGKADIDAAYQRALQAGWSPADAAAKRDSLYQANGITP